MSSKWFQQVNHDICLYVLNCFSLCCVCYLYAKSLAYWIVSPVLDYVLNFLKKAMLCSILLDSVALGFWVLFGLVFFRFVSQLYKPRFLWFQRQKSFKFLSTTSHRHSLIMINNENVGKVTLGIPRPIRSSSSFGCLMSGLIKPGLLLAKIRNGVMLLSLFNAVLGYY